MTTGIIVFDDEASFWPAFGPIPACVEAVLDGTVNRLISELCERGVEDIVLVAGPHLASILNDVSRAAVTPEIVRTVLLPKRGAAAVLLLAGIAVARSESIIALELSSRFAVPMPGELARMAIGDEGRLSYAYPAGNLCGGNGFAGFYMGRRASFLAYLLAERDASMGRIEMLVEHALKRADSGRMLRLDGPLGTRIRSSISDLLAGPGNGKAYQPYDAVPTPRPELLVEADLDDHITAAFRLFGSVEAVKTPWGQIARKTLFDAASVYRMRLNRSAWVPPFISSGSELVILTESSAVRVSSERDCLVLTAGDPHVIEAGECVAMGNGALGPVDVVIASFGPFGAERAMIPELAGVS